MTATSQPMVEASDLDELFGGLPNQPLSAVHGFELPRRPGCGRVTSGLPAGYRPPGVRVPGRRGLLWKAPLRRAWLGVGGHAGRRSA